MALSLSRRLRQDQVWVNERVLRTKSSWISFSWSRCCLQHLHSFFAFTSWIQVLHSSSAFTSCIHFRHDPLSLFLTKSAFIFCIHLLHSSSAITSCIHFRHDLLSLLLTKSAITSCIHVLHSSSAFTSCIRLLHSLWPWSTINSWHPLLIIIVLSVDILRLGRNSLCPVLCLSSNTLNMHDPTLDAT